MSFKVGFFVKEKQKTYPKATLRLISHLSESPGESCIQFFKTSGTKKNHRDGKVFSTKALISFKNRDRLQSSDEISRILLGFSCLTSFQVFQYEIK